MNVSRVCYSASVYILLSGLNFTDLMVRQGVMENLPKTPFVMGFECSGEVEALGENVDNFAVSQIYASFIFS